MLATHPSTPPCQTVGRPARPVSESQRQPCARLAQAKGDRPRPRRPPRPLALDVAALDGLLSSLTARGILVGIGDLIAAAGVCLKDGRHTGGMLPPHQRRAVIVDSFEEVHVATRRGARQPLLWRRGRRLLTTYWLAEPTTWPSTSFATPKGSMPSTARTISQSADPGTGLISVVMPGVPDAGRTCACTGRP